MAFFTKHKPRFYQKFTTYEAAYKEGFEDGAAREALEWKGEKEEYKCMNAEARRERDVALEKIKGLERSERAWSGMYDVLATLSRAICATEKK